MKKLETISIILMVEDNQGNKLEYNNFLRKASNVFGGFTTTNQKGGWFSEETDSIMIDESIKLDLCFATDEYSYQHESIIQSILEYLFITGGQEAVFASINGQSYILESDDILEFSEQIATLSFTL